MRKYNNYKNELVLRPIRIPSKGEEILIHAENNEYTIENQHFLVEFSVFFNGNMEPLPFSVLMEAYDSKDKLHQVKQVKTRTLTNALNEIVYKIKSLESR